MLFFTSILCTSITFYKKDSCLHCQSELASIHSKNLKITILDCDDHCDQYVYGPFKSRHLSNILEHLVPKLSDFEASQPVYKPTLIYFYHQIDTFILEMLQRLSLAFPQVNFVRIKSDQLSIVGHNGELVRKYMYQYSYDSLRSWIDTMFSKMEVLTLENFNADSVFFVVFYKEMEDVRQFSNIHHMNRFKYKMYKSDDKRMLKMSGVDFERMGNGKGMVVLCLYRNSWHKLIIPRFNERYVREWMDNAYYPHVTVINDSNMYTVFHGIKPTLFLVNTGETSVEVGKETVVGLKETDVKVEKEMDVGVKELNVEVEKETDVGVKETDVKVENDSDVGVEKDSDVGVEKDSDVGVKELNVEKSKQQSDMKLEEQLNVKVAKDSDVGAKETDVGVKELSVKKHKKQSDIKLEEQSNIKSEERPDIKLKGEALESSLKDKSNDKLLDTFEKISIKLHNNKAFIDYVFALINSEYKYLTDRLLPGLTVPNIVVYEPKRMLYYYDKEGVNFADLEGSVIRLMKKYEDGKLETWPPEVKKRRWKYLWVGVILVGVMFCLGTRRAKKYKIQ